MSQYKTIRNFWDIELKTTEYPKGKLYKKGEIYPVEGIEVTEERLHELSTYNNRAGEIFIKLVEEDNKVDSKESSEASKETEESSEASKETEESSEASKETEELSEASKETEELSEEKPKRGRKRKDD